MGGETRDANFPPSPSPLFLNPVQAIEGEDLVEAVRGVVVVEVGYYGRVQDGGVQDRVGDVELREGERAAGVAVPGVSDHGVGHVGADDLVHDFLDVRQQHGGRDIAGPAAHVQEHLLAVGAPLHQRHELCEDRIGVPPLQAVVTSVQIRFMHTASNSRPAVRTTMDISEVGLSTCCVVHLFAKSSRARHKTRNLNQHSVN